MTTLLILALVAGLVYLLVPRYSVEWVRFTPSRYLDSSVNAVADLTIYVGPLDWTYRYYTDSGTLWYREDTGNWGLLTSRSLQNQAKVELIKRRGTL